MRFFTLLLLSFLATSASPQPQVPFSGRMISSPLQFTAVQSGAMGDGVMLDGQVFTTVTNASQPPTWNWMGPHFNFRLASAGPPPVSAVDVRMWRNSSGPVQIRFMSPDETTFFGPGGGAWQILPMSFNGQQLWAAATYRVTVSGTQQDVTYYDKTDSWTAWRTQIPAVAPNTLPSEMGGHRIWADCMVVQASHQEIIWPVWYQAFTTICRISVTNASGTFVERWDPNTPTGGSQLPRRDTFFDPFNSTANS